MKTLNKNQGRRRPDNTFQHELDPGDYSKVCIDGQWTWMGKTPTGLNCWLKNHKCIENADGTLSILPPQAGEGPNSILCSEGIKSWHGFIYNGVWREIG